jgi:hypothetical protein
MDASLFIGTKDEKRMLICFLWAEGVPGAEMHRRMSVQYGNSVMSHQIVYKWVKRFKNGHSSINHKEGARLLSTSITDANMEHVSDMILQNRLRRATVGTSSREGFNSEQCSQQ